MILIRDAGAIVGQGGRSFEKGTCTDCDVIMTAECELKGYFSQKYAPNHFYISWPVMKF